MQGHIRRRSKGSWEITIDLGRDPTNGHRRRRFLSIKGTKRDAERILVADGALVIRHLTELVDMLA